MFRVSHDFFSVFGFGFSFFCDLRLGVVLDAMYPLSVTLLGGPPDHLDYYDRVRADVEDDKRHEQPT
jgi:hypothetical protein